MRYIFHFTINVWSEAISAQSGCPTISEEQDFILGAGRKSCALFLPSTPSPLANSWLNARSFDYRASRLFRRFRRKSFEFRSAIKLKCNFPFRASWLSPRRSTSARCTGVSIFYFAVESSSFSEVPIRVRKKRRARNKTAGTFVVAGNPRRGDAYYSFIWRNEGTRGLRGSPADEDNQASWPRRMKKLRQWQGNGGTGANMAGHEFTN